ncbi:MAG: sigma-54 dependent transcriptional regulator [Desulfobacteraceae bacterium]|jgi:two-component system NtrC family response regulator
MGKALFIGYGDVVESAVQLLSTIDHEAEIVEDLRRGWELAARENADVVALAVKVGGGDGLALLPRLKQLPHSPEVVVLSAVADPKAAEFALRNGAWDVLQVQAGAQSIATSIDQALLYRKEQKGETPPLSVKREKIIGNSPGMKHGLQLLGQAAASDANVLITGETGTGKELFARAIHSNSPRSRALGDAVRSSNPRADKNFVVVDCTALPETLVESVLFGHIRGAFTGADRNHDGLIAQADGGTLFLDEVGELPITTQKTFLRVLQERRYRPVGAKDEKESSFRLIAATHRDLDQLAEAGQFRKDLLFRLRALSIELPPLRRRREDIEDLIRYHTSRLCKVYGMKPKGFSIELMEALKAYPWPGNVREMINAIDGMLAAGANDSTLYAKHLPLQMRIQIVCSNLKGPQEGVRQEAGPGADGLPAFKAYRESSEYKYLQELMRLTHRNIPEACRVSGISRSRLYEMLAKYGLNSIK